MTDFEKWWYEIGSGIAVMPDHDFEEHAGRIASVAWKTATKQLRKERDEARRMYCEHQLLFHSNGNKNYHKLTALENNWDCFKETT